MDEFPTPQRRFNNSCLNPWLTFLNINLQRPTRHLVSQQEISRKPLEDDSGLVYWNKRSKKNIFALQQLFLSLASKAEKRASEQEMVKFIFPFQLKGEKIIKGCNCRQQNMQFFLARCSILRIDSVRSACFAISFVTCLLIPSAVISNLYLLNTNRQLMIIRLKQTVYCVVFP